MNDSGSGFTDVYFLLENIRAHGGVGGNRRRGGGPGGEGGGAALIALPPRARSVLNYCYFCHLLCKMIHGLRIITVIESKMRIKNHKKYLFATLRPVIELVGEATHPRSKLCQPSSARYNLSLSRIIEV